MGHLYEVLGRCVDRWRADGYPVEDFPAIAELFEWASDPDTGTMRYLRRPQLRALETYWYLARRPVVAEVVEVVDKPAGTIVHLRLLPGAIEDYEAFVRRALTPA